MTEPLLVKRVRDALKGLLPTCLIDIVTEYIPRVIVRVDKLEEEWVIEKVSGNERSVIWTEYSSWPPCDPPDRVIVVGKFEGTTDDWVPYFPRFEVDFNPDRPCTIELDVDLGTILSVTPWYDWSSCI